MKQSRIWDLFGNAECNERHRMGVNDSRQVPARAIDRLMEWKFGRRWMATFDLAVWLHANDVVSAKLTFVDPRRRNPNLVVDSTNRKVSAGSGRHTKSIDQVDRLNEFVARMDK